MIYDMWGMICEIYVVYDIWYLIIITGNRDEDEDDDDDDPTADGGDILRWWAMVFDSKRARAARVKVIRPIMGILTMGK